MRLPESCNHCHHKQRSCEERPCEPTPCAEELRIMSLPGMQKKFPKDWMVGDRAYIERYGIGIYHSNGLIYFGEFAVTPDFKTIIRLPLSIDPDNPSRGLWGMVDKTKYRIDLHHLGATVTQMYSADGSVPYDMKTYTTPTLALLKALAHQWEVEI